MSPGRSDPGSRPAGPPTHLAVVEPLRIALLLDPFTLQVKGGTHAPELARELLWRGHVVRGFGAPPGVIPRSRDGVAEGEDEVDGLSGAGVIGFRPEVVVAYDALSPAAFLGARVARRVGVPLVLVESGFAAAGRLYERALRGIGEHLWGPYVRHAAARVIALDPVARELALREGFAPERVEVMPTGVDLARFRPGLLSSTISRHLIRGRVLLHIGRIAERRGLETLVEAFARTVGQRSDWTLVLAGDGPAQRRLRAAVERTGIGARVSWLGRPRPDELPGLMGGSTLFAAPAIDDSVMGSHLPKAMACGLPVVASDLPRLRFYVENDGSGLLAKPGDVRDWVSALGRATGEPEARKRWAQRSRAIAESRFAWARVAQGFEQLFVALRAEAAARAEARGVAASDA